MLTSPLPRGLLRRAAARPPRAPAVSSSCVVADQPHGTTPGNRQRPIPNPPTTHIDCVAHQISALSRFRSFMALPNSRSSARCRRRRGRGGSRQREQAAKILLSQGQSKHDARRLARSLLWPLSTHDSGPPNRWGRPQRSIEGRLIDRICPLRHGPFAKPTAPAAGCASSSPARTPPQSNSRPAARSSRTSLIRGSHRRGLASVRGRRMPRHPVYSPTQCTVASTRLTPRPWHSIHHRTDSHPQSGGRRRRQERKPAAAGTGAWRVRHFLVVV